MNPPLNKLAWWLALALGTAIAPAGAREQPLDGLQTSVSAECRAMQGTYAVTPLVDTPGFSALVAEFTHPSIAIGKPVFALEMSAAGMTRTGAVSNNAVLLQQADAVPSKPLFAGVPIACALQDHGSQMQIVHADLRAMPAPGLHDLAGYLGQFWEAKVDPEALRQVSVFLVIDASMTGVASMFIMIPFNKL